ncbi:MAG: carbamate kinase [Betaproteobacteria bacterium]|nr:carbamate kinase [Betaproteobacteria bacterium]
MSTHAKLAVVAVGGNALIRDEQHRSIPDQYETARATVGYIVDMVEAGSRVVLTHGSGPQMGFILRRSELALSEVSPIPMDYAGADLQGAIGYMFVKAFRNEFRRRGLAREAVAVVTQVLVDRDDPAFRDPTKPIGSPMDEATARERMRTLGWQVRPDPGRGWRRVVPSPIPKAILDLKVIAHLVDSGYVVIACGGGGIPVIQDEQGETKGVEAVIDKDLSSSLLARDLHSNSLVIATGIEKVALDFGKPTQRWVDRMTLAQAKQYLADGQFDRGSMGPKVEAMIEFVESGAGEGIITDPPHLTEALAGRAGTRVVVQ